jgi:outer membrane biosynthesis protein TonB
MSVMPYSGGNSAVMLMPGAGYNLQSLPGYVGNNPPMVVASAKNVFEQPQYPVQQAVQVQQQQQQTIIPRPPPPPRVVVEPKIYIHQPPPRVVVDPPAPPPPVITPPPPVVTQPPPAPSTYEQAKQAHAIVQATQQQQLPTAEAPKSSGTATAVSIGAAGILAALLFK